jgi:hypothetical protein
LAREEREDRRRWCWWWFEDLTKLLSLWVEIHGNCPYNTKCLELSSAIPHTE